MRETCWMNSSGLSEKAIFRSYFTFRSKNNMRATSITQAGYLFATQRIQPPRFYSALHVSCSQTATAVHAKHKNLL